MKPILLAAVFALAAVAASWAQEPPTGFSFTWESGEHSRDMSIDRSTWRLDGTTLKYSDERLGRNEAIPMGPLLFRDKVGLSRSQLAKMTSILEGLVNEDSVTLLPKDFEGSLTEYTLSFGNPPRIVYFSAADFTVEKIEKENPPAAAKPAKPAPGSALYLRMNVLRDYLMDLSRRQ